MALVFSRLIKIIAGLGLGGALVQSQNLNDHTLSSVFWFNMSLGFFFSMVLASLAPLGAWFYNEPILSEIILVVSFNLFVTTLGGVHQSLLRRQLKFKGIALLKVLSMIIANISGIILVVMGFGIWGLVARLTVNTVILAIMVWFISSWRPLFYFKWVSVRQLLNYGGYMTLTNVVYYFTENIDFLLIGRLFGPAYLGAYTLAFNLPAILGEQVKSNIASVLFPAFSKIQNEEVRLRKVFLLSMTLTSLFLLPSLCGLGAVSSELIQIVYGDKWQTASKLLPILSMVGLAKGLRHLVNSMILSKGFASVIFRIESFHAFLMIVIFIPICFLTTLQIIALFYTFIQAIILMLALNFALRILDTQFHSLWIAIRAPVKATILMALSILLLKYVLKVYFSMNGYFILFSMILFGVIIYVVFVYAFTHFNERKVILSIVMPS